MASHEAGAPVTKTVPKSFEWPSFFKGLLREVQPAAAKTPSHDVTPDFLVYLCPVSSGEKDVSFLAFCRPHGAEIVQQHVDMTSRRLPRIFSTHNPSVPRGINPFACSPLPKEKNPE